MKKYILLGFALLMLAARLPAQNGIVGNLNAATTTCLVSNSCLILSVAQNDGGATIKLSGTWSATVQFEATADPLTVLPTAASWVALSATPSNSTTTATSATANGAWQVNISGYQRIRIRVSAYTSGTVAGAINLSTASARGGSGSGGSPPSTVTACGTAASPDIAIFSAPTVVCGTAALVSSAPGEVDQTVVGIGTFRSLSSTGNPTFSGGEGIVAAGAEPTAFYDLEWSTDNFTTASFLALGGATGRARIGTTSATPSSVNAYADGHVTVITDPTSTGMSVTGALSATGAISSGPDGTHNGDLALVGNTTDAVLAANTANILGPIIAAPTAYGLRMASVGPTTGQCFGPFGTVTGANVAPITFGACVSATPAFSSISSGTNTTATMICGTGCSLSSVPQVNIGAVGTAGVLGLVGVTSGTATLSAPAAAGTTTNPVVSSNGMQFPNGASTTPTVTFAGCSATCGFSETGGTGIVANLNTSGTYFISVAGTNKWRWDTTAFYVNAAPLIFNTAPTIAGAGCGGSAASIAANNGPSSFTINVGTAPTSAGCTVTLPAATTAWNCFVNDKTTISTAVSMQKQTGADSTTSVTFQNYSDLTVATAPAANDIYSVSCFAR